MPAGKDITRVSDTGWKAPRLVPDTQQICVVTIVYTISNRYNLEWRGPSPALFGVLILRKVVVHYTRPRDTDANADQSLKSRDIRVCIYMYIHIHIHNLKVFLIREWCADNVHVKSDNIHFVTHSTHCYPEPSLFHVVKADSISLYTGLQVRVIFEESNMGICPSKAICNWLILIAKWQARSDWDKWKTYFRG